MLKQSLQTKLGQSLTMTPQLQQAIRLLQMPAMELAAHINDMLESNVMLEQEDLDDEQAVIPEVTAAERVVDAETTEPVEVEVVDQPWADRPGTGVADNRRVEAEVIADLTGRGVLVAPQRAPETGAGRLPQQE